jgi:putative sugar O-methyltransferase
MKLVKTLGFFAVFFLFLVPNILFGMSAGEFSSWWKDYRKNSNVPPELKVMEDYVVSSQVLKTSSDFWNDLNKKNIEQIVTYGYENFKQTVTQNYFTWVVNSNHVYSINLMRIPSGLLVPLPKAEMEKVHALFSPAESYQFNLITQYFLSYILSIGGAPFLEKLEEPMIGNPPCLTYKGKRISQDIFNSLLEYLPISQHCPLEKFSTIIEIGAGSGRTAFCFLTLHPHVKYVIVDFPPALFISQKYLSAVFPDRKVMVFRPFANFEEVATEYEEADIVFLTSDQLEKLPNKSGDLFLAIDCLHEMKPEAIAHYFSEAGRLCSYCYFKCWQSTVCDGHFYSSDNYPVPPNWRVCFKEPCLVPSGFFHAFYQIPIAKD